MNGASSVVLPEQEGDARSRRLSTDLELRTPRVAVLVPCLNEETTVGEVVRGFARALPTADIYVYDNGSTDQTARVAREAGAVIRTEVRPGKGNVVRRMFSEVTADVYVLVDGDGTYDARDAPEMVRRLWNDGCDMVVGRRMAEGSEAYRRGHRTGNAALTQTVAKLFGRSTNDMLSGYRAVSKAYVSSFPMKSSGFEIETEMTIHALSMQMPISEVDTRYTQRPVGSHSKLRTVPDWAPDLAAGPANPARLPPRGSVRDCCGALRLRRPYSPRNWRRLDDQPSAAGSRLRCGELLRVRPRDGVNRTGPPRVQAAHVPVSAR